MLSSIVTLEMQWKPWMNNSGLGGVRTLGFPLPLAKILTECDEHNEKWRKHSLHTAVKGGCKAKNISCVNQIYDLGFYLHRLPSSPSCGGVNCPFGPGVPPGPYCKSVWKVKSCSSLEVRKLSLLDSIILIGLWLQSGGGIIFVRVYLNDLAVRYEQCWGGSTTQFLHCLPQRLPLAMRTWGWEGDSEEWYLIFKSCSNFIKHQPTQKVSILLARDKAHNQAFFSWNTHPTFNCKKVT